MDWVEGSNQRLRTIQRVKEHQASFEEGFGFEIKIEQSAAEGDTQSTEREATSTKDTKDIPPTGEDDPQDDNGEGATTVPEWQEESQFPSHATSANLDLMMSSALPAGTTGDHTAENSDFRSERDLSRAMIKELRV